MKHTVVLDARNELINFITTSFIIPTFPKTQKYRIYWVLKYVFQLFSDNSARNVLSCITL